MTIYTKNKKTAILLSLILLLTFISGCAGGGSARAGDSDREPVDFDLTGLSVTVLSAEVTNIYMNARDNVGKTIRVNGIYQVAASRAGDFFHYIVTKDGDDCCQEGFEIRVSSDLVFPDDFPPNRSHIEVDGVFSSYMSNGTYIYYLAVDEILKP